MPTSTPAAARARGFGQELGDRFVGHPVAAAGLGADGAGEDGREHFAVVVDQRAAGVAGTHQPAQRRQQPRDGAAAVGVLR